MNLIEHFESIRRVSTPWLAVRTPDYRVTAIKLCEATIDPEDGQKPIAVLWDCVNGPKSPLVNPQGEIVSLECKLDVPTDFRMYPSATLEAAYSMPTGAMLFMVVPGPDFFSDMTAQAIANLREHFKSTSKTLILLGPDFKLHPLIAQDMPILDDPYPSATEIADVTRLMITSANQQRERDGESPIEITDEELQQAGDICLGMSPFAAEEAISRCITTTGIDYDELRDLRRRSIENSSGSIRFETEKWRFSDMGGAEAWISFARSLYKGRKFKLVVRVDEIEKVITSAASGTVADNTGVSQDFLRVFLTTLEDYGHLAVLFKGPPGVGKTMASIGTGNEFGVTTLSYDPNAAKSSLLGATEARVRNDMKTFLAMAGRDILWIGTCNRDDTLPPELKARFWLGTWFWDKPLADERKAIWAIQTEKHGLKQQPLPDDTDWVGRDIRNCCRMAQIHQCSILNATQWLTISGIVNRGETDKAREEAANKGYLSATSTGPYKIPSMAKQVTRKIRT